MVSAAARKIAYLLDSLELSQISALTEIPSATLSMVLDMGDRLPSQYAKPLRNLYQRTAYRNLREAGLSPTQARRFSWYGAPAVKKQIGFADDIIARYTNARMPSWTKSLKDRGMFIDEATTYQELYASIKDAVEHSTLPPERHSELADAYAESKTGRFNTQRRKGDTSVDTETF